MLLLSQLTQENQHGPTPFFLPWECVGKTVTLGSRPSSSSGSRQALSPLGLRVSDWMRGGAMNWDFGCEAI